MSQNLIYSAKRLFAHFGEIQALCYRVFINCIKTNPNIYWYCIFMLISSDNIGGPILSDNPIKYGFVDLKVSERTIYRL